MKKLASLLLTSALAWNLHADPMAFDFKDPKGVNNIVFKLDAPLEAINGSTTGISGKVSFDPEKGESLKGKIVVDAKSLTVPNPLMNEHLHGAEWLEVDKYPEISFETESVANVKTEGFKTSADVTGTLTIKGVSNKVTIPVKLTYLKDRLKDRVPKMEGDLLVLRSEFVIKRGDFNIMKGQALDKVSDEITLVFSLAGAAPKK